MKKLALILCIFALACTRSGKEGCFIIEGHLKGVRDGTVISLFAYDGNMGIGVATDTVKNGKFSFSYPLTGSAKLSLGGPYDDPEFPSMGREIWAVSGEKAVVRGDNTLIFTWKVKSRVPKQTEADRYMLRSRNEYDRVQRLQIEENTARLNPEAEPRRKSIDSLRYLQDEVDMVIFRNDIAVMDETPVSEIWLDKLHSLTNTIKHYPDKYGVFKDDALRLYEKLTPEQQELPVAQAVHINLFPPEKVKPGDKMADARLKDPEGTQHRLSDYPGRYVLLDFWGSGCGACVYSMPKLKEIGGKYGDILTLIGINLDTSEDAWRKGTKMWNPPGLNLNAPQGSGIAERYGVNAIPHYVLISPAGIIVDAWDGYRDGHIESLLAGDAVK